MGHIKFVASASLESVALAAGALNTGASDAPPCPLAVGDLICDPSAPGIYFAVTRRLFHIASGGKPAGWYLFVEQADDPFPARQQPAQA